MTPYNNNECPLKGSAAILEVGALEVETIARCCSAVFTFSSHPPACCTLELFRLEWFIGTPIHWRVNNFAIILVAISQPYCSVSLFRSGKDSPTLVVFYPCVLSS